MQLFFYPLACALKLILFFLQILTPSIVSIPRKLMAIYAQNIRSYYTYLKECQPAFVDDVLTAWRKK